MTLAAAVGLVLLGLALLAGGGDLLVRGATTVARLAGLTPAVIGLTVVAMGTSLPELTVSVMASLRGQPDIAVGNVVGSNIANIGLILGIAAVVCPLPIRGSVVRLEWPVMFLASAAFYLVARDLVLDRLEAGFFLLSLIAFLGYSVRLARREVTAEQERAFEQEVSQFAVDRPARRLHVKRLGLSLALLVVGIALLVLGGKWLVDGAVRLAELAGLTERVIGLSIVAVGTSAPEIATSVVAAVRRQADIAVANAIGSNIFNLLGIMGTAGLILPLRVSPGMLGSDVWWMLGIAVLLLLLIRVGMNLSRTNGVLLLASYAVYLGLLLG